MNQSLARSAAVNFQSNLICNTESASRSSQGICFLNSELYFQPRKEFDMGLLLPVLLLGLAQSADLPANVSQPVTVAQADSNSGSSAIPPRQFTLGDPKFGRLQRLDPIQVMPDPDAHPTVCLTMRSYFFERRDGMAPEFVGMTTCDPGRGRILKKINRRPAGWFRLVSGGARPGFARPSAPPAPRRLRVRFASLPRATCP